jgi:hypothetical protein
VGLRRGIDGVWHEVNAQALEFLSEAPTMGYRIFDIRSQAERREAVSIRRAQTWQELFPYSEPA